MSRRLTIHHHHYPAQQPEAPPPSGPGLGTFLLVAGVAALIGMAIADSNRQLPGGDS